MTDFEQLGGEAAVRAHVDALVERFAADTIIGFTFHGRDLAAIKAREYTFAANHLGAGIAYDGRPLGATHKPLRINKGQFRRRLALLRTVLRERGVPDDIVARWSDYEARFERAVTDGTDCVD